MKKPVLVIMAAGMGSRYGGLKQIDPIDEDGHIIIDFSLYDAKRAGFEEAVFIIKRENEKDFKEAIGNRMEGIMKIHYAFQELTNIPKGNTIPAERVKPWGTAHAIYCCKDIIDGPFAVINADDYYGVEAFQLIYDYLSTHDDDYKYRYTMVGYQVEKTLTENGTVARGVCEVDQNHYLTDIVERTKIKKTTRGAAYTEDELTWYDLPVKSTVSMNLWGFSKSIMEEISQGMQAFLDDGLVNNPLKCEYFIPSVVSRLIQENKATVEVLTTKDQWYGVTYKEDKPVIMKAIQEMKDNGIYPQKLWGEKIMANHELLKEVISHFDFVGTLLSCEPYGSGHINDTYLLQYKIKHMGVIPIILQKMNTNIFKEPEQLMENILNVTDFLREKIIQNNGDPERETLTVILNKEKKPYYLDSEGNYWRGYHFITGTTGYDEVKCDEDFYQSALAFGKFQSLLADYPAHTLHETIPDFHNTKARFEVFKKAVEKDICNRAKDVQEEIQFVLNHEDVANVLTDMQNEGKLPLRVTHNDTKLNNVLIDDKTHQGICVIDLDTVMPGLAINDFGDSIRFGASTGAEDEKDLSKINCDMHLFEVYTRGFIEGCGGKLTDEEIKALPIGAKVMTFECGMRFLTDYLEGDTYFKTKYPTHNLDRCRTQFKLVSDMETKWDTMNKIVAKYNV